MIATPGQSTHIITPSAIAALRGAAGCRGAAADQLLWRQSQGCGLGGPADLREGPVGWMSAAEGERALCFTGRGEDGLQMGICFPTDLDQVHRLDDFGGGEGPA